MISGTPCIMKHSTLQEAEAVVVVTARTGAGAGAGTGSWMEKGGVTGVRVSRPGSQYRPSQ